MAKNRFKLLIVEDDSNIRTFLRTMLEAEDYQVLCAADCRTGISMFTSHCPDLVILDLGLPDLDGTEFIPYARQYTQAPILVLSARTTDTDTGNVQLVRWSLVTKRCTHYVARNNCHSCETCT